MCVHKHPKDVLEPGEEGEGELEGGEVGDCVCVWMCGCVCVCVRGWVCEGARDRVRVRSSVSMRVSKRVHV